MAKFSKLTLIDWLNKFYPPSSNSIHKPEVLSESVQLIQRSLPSSLIFDRLELREQSTINPSTLVNVGGPPAGRFWWVHAADFTVQNGVVAGNGVSSIQVINPNFLDRSVTVAQGIFSTADILVRTFTRTLGVAGSGGGFAGGGTGGSFVVPQGHQLVGNTSATPGAATTFRLSWLFAELVSGEEFPEI